MKRRGKIKKIKNNGIRWRLIEILKKTKRFKFIFCRSEDLFSKKLYLEFMLLNSQLIEENLKDAINRYKNILDLSFDISLATKRYCLKVPDFVNKNITLGKLINVFQEIFKGDGLYKDLKRFNEFRNIIAHQIFNPKINLQKMNEEITNYVKKFRVHNLIINLQKFTSHLDALYFIVLFKKEGKSTKEINHFIKEFCELPNKLSD